MAAEVLEPVTVVPSLQPVPARRSVRSQGEISQLVKFIENCPREERPSRLQQLDPPSISTLLRRADLCTVSETANQFHDCPSYRASIFRCSLQEGGVPVIGARVTKTSSAHVLATVDQLYAWQVLLDDRQLDPYLTTHLEQARLKLDQLSRYWRKNTGEILERMRQESEQRMTDNEDWFRDLREGYYQQLRALNGVSDGHLDGLVADAAETENIRLDPAVVNRAQAGDQKTFEQIYDQYHLPIYNYVYRMMGDPENAADLTQDTFLKVFQALPKTSEDLRVEPWLYRIATNVCLDVLRHRKLIKWGPWESFTTVFHPSQVARENPERDVLERENRQEVLAIYDRLHPKYRLCLILREYYDLSYDEIAEILDTTRAAVKSLLFRARGEFRQVYAQSERQPVPLGSRV